MRILGIDTSSKYCNLSIMEDDDILIELSINGEIKRHSSILIPTIKEMLLKLNMQIQAIDGIAVTIGPGSFTGLRIGLGAAKGLAYALSIPVAGVVTLDALALNVKTMPYVICPVLDARKEEIYFALYRGGEHLKRFSNFQCASIKELLKKLEEVQGNILFLGEGALKYQKVLKQNIGFRSTFISPLVFVLKASNVAYIGMRAIKDGRVENISSLSPLYLRKSEAEIVKEIFRREQKLREK